MRHCHYWAITLDEAKEIQTDKPREEQTFELQYTVEKGMLHLAMHGRLDTISAPKLLLAWEKANADGRVEEVRIDCAQLEYISSAGIRLLREMQENCSHHIVFSGASVKVKEILQQKGFGDVI